MSVRRILTIEVERALGRSGPEVAEVVDALLPDALSVQEDVEDWGRWTARQLGRALANRVGEDVTWTMVFEIVQAEVARPRRGYDEAMRAEAGSMLIEKLLRNRLGPRRGSLKGYLRSAYKRCLSSIASERRSQLRGGAALPETEVGVDDEDYEVVTASVSWEQDRATGRPLTSDVLLAQGKDTGDLSALLAGDLDGILSALARRSPDDARRVDLLRRHHLGGVTQQVLAAELGVSQATISRHLRAVRGELRSMLFGDGP